MRTIVVLMLALTAGCQKEPKRFGILMAKHGDIVEQSCYTTDFRWCATPEEIQPCLRSGPAVCEWAGLWVLQLAAAEPKLEPYNFATTKP